MSTIIKQRGRWLAVPVFSATDPRSPWVFQAPKREAGHTSPAHDIRDILVVKHGLPWSPHDLRVVTGHASSQHLDRYINLDPADVARKAVK